MTVRQLRWFVPCVIAFASLGLGACSPTDQPIPEAQQDAESELANLDEQREGEGKVTLTEAAFLSSGITVADVVARTVADAAGSESVPGQVDFDPARVAVVSPRTSGRIERLAVVEGDAVSRGDVVAWVLSREFLTAQNDFLQATRRARLLSGTEDERGATALAEAARQRLRLVGADDTLIERLIESELALDLIPIRAPFSGSIVRAHALTGSAVESGSPIYTLADLSEVTVVADVPEGSLSRLHIGQTADIVLSAYPGERIRGTVERIREELDPTTRTAKAILRVQNPESVLRPGMFASVRLHGDIGSSLVSRPVIPIGAVVTDGSERYVFVEVGPQTFERRDVETEPLSESELIVRSGLLAGERLVIRGAFTIKAELAKDEFGGEHH